MDTYYQQMRAFIDAAYKPMNEEAPDAKTSVIQRLNDALLMEFSASNQYFVHSIVLKSLGYETLSEDEMQESNEEKTHMSLYTNRILALGDLPARLPKAPPEIHVGNDIEEILKNDLEGELTAIEFYQESAEICSEAGDQESAELFLQIMSDEEEHANKLRGHLAILDQDGDESFR